MTNGRPYPVYKSSDVEWLGTIPSHWKIQRLRSVAQLAASNVDKIHVEGEQQVRLCNYTDVYNHHRITDKMAFMLGTATKEEIRRFSLRSGDVMFTKDSESFDDIGIPAVAGNDLENVVLGYHLMLARPSISVYGPYLAWFFSSKQNRWQFEVSANGVTRFGMPQSGFKDAVVSIPPLDEQRAIADFLDVADARISRYIAAKRRMIALLEEQKQAIINQAVTRGLDPDVPLKASGVDWLGDIPAHWDVRRFKHVARVEGFLVDPTREPYMSMILIAPNHVTKGTSELIAQETASEQGADSGKYLVQGGQIVYSKIRPYLRKAVLAPMNCLCSADMYPISPNKRLLRSTFLLQLLLSDTSTRFIVDSSLRARMPKVNREALGGLSLAFPSLQEQDQILLQLGFKLQGPNSVVDRIRREIVLIQEYRTRLISDVVTGKLDVRGVELPALEEFVDVAIENVTNDVDDDTTAVSEEE